MQSTLIWYSQEEQAAKAEFVRRTLVIVLFDGRDTSFKPQWQNRSVSET